MGKASQRRKQKRKAEQKNTESEQVAWLLNQVTRIANKSENPDEVRVFRVTPNADTSRPYQIEKIDTDLVDTPEIHKAYIEKHWDYIAAASWSGFLNEGKGAVAVLSLHSPSSDQLKVEYWSLEKLSQSFNLASQKQMFDEYDPKTQVVILIVQADGQLCVYWVSRTPTPPQAHEIRLVNQHKPGNLPMAYNPLPLGSDTPERQKEYLYEKWSQLAALAWDGYQNNGRGAVVMSADTTDIVADKTYFSFANESMLIEVLRNEPALADLQRMLQNYDPEKQIVVLVQRTDRGFSMYTLGGYPSPPEAYTIHEEMEETHNLGIIYLHYYPDLVNYSFSVASCVHNHIQDPRMKDVQQLAMKLIYHATTLFHITRIPELLVPRITTEESIVDFSSAIVLGRTTLETYVTMFEVFFEPHNDDEFEFQHALWQLAGFVFAEDYPVDNPAIKHQSALAKNEADTHRNRIKQTQKYISLTEPQKKQVLKGKRTRDWQAVAKSAGFGAVTLRKVYSQHSGYVHADGLSGQQLEISTKEQIDRYLDSVMFTVMIVLSKMILNYNDKFPSALEACEEDSDMLNFAKQISTIASQMD
jgi:hypothetical protein